MPEAGIALSGGDSADLSASSVVTCCLWAAVDFVRGVSAMREGALDVYGVVMIRCRYTDALNVRSRIVYQEILASRVLTPTASTISFVIFS